MNSLLNQNQVVYSLDSSTLFDAFKWYPIDNFPAFWCKIEGLINSDRLKIAEVAFDEVMKDERVREWCNQNQLIPSLKWETDASIQSKASEVLLEFPRLVDARTGKSAADPWVVALVLISQDCIVLTEEDPTTKPLRPKIPEACNYFGVEYIKLVDLIRKENWVFNTVTGR